jgi:hypothetical protein
MLSVVKITPLRKLRESTGPRDGHDVAPVLTFRRLVLCCCAALVARPALRSALVGLREALTHHRGRRERGEIPTAAPSLGLVAAVAADELFLQPIGAITSSVPARHYRRSSEELDAAIGFYDEQGWLDRPLGYFDTPPRPDRVEVRRRRWCGETVELLRFSSGWEPHPGEPGRDRWLSFVENRVAHVTVFRHHDGPRPWLIAAHGQGQGNVGDARRLRLLRVHRELGVNVALPTLPLHGKRRAGLGWDAMFVSPVYPMNNVFGLAQSTWDVRRLLAWVRDDQEAPAVGLFGLSLGSFVCGLVGMLETDLACLIAVVPGGDLAASTRAHEPVLPSKRDAHRVVNDWRSTLVHHVVSPLSGPCLVPYHRRLVVAGLADQVATPAGTVLLWQHWQRPPIEWLPRGHLTIGYGRAYVERLMKTCEDTLGASAVSAASSSATTSNDSSIAAQ